MARTDQLWNLEGDHLLERVTQALTRQPLTVTSLPSPRSAGGPHDFHSEADYYWPHPDDPKAPFVQRDGLRWPGLFNDHRWAMQTMAQDVAALATVAVHDNQPDLAAHALTHLRAWFADRATRMSPHLEFAQAITGVCTGRGIAIIDTVHLAEPARALAVLFEAGLVTEDEAAPIKEWFAAYLDWIRAHPYGVDERDHGNNHSSAWAFQAAAFAALIGDDEALDEAEALFREALIADQIQPDGSMPLELRRTRPYHYVLFNLDVMAATAQQLALTGRQVWAHETSDGRSFVRALEWMLPHISDKNSWPLPDDIELFDEVPARTAALVLAAEAFDRDDWFELWTTLPSPGESQDAQRAVVLRSPMLWLG